MNDCGPQIVYLCGLTAFTESARYRVRTCDPYRVKVVLYH